MTPLQQNCSLIWDDQTLQAAIVDPGGDLDQLLAEVDPQDYRLAQDAARAGRQRQVQRCSGGTLATTQSMPLVRTRSWSADVLTGLP